MEEQLMSGPYRATLLWNSLIRVFLSDVPLGRHRRYMKAYDKCFVASDAVEWLHQYLIKSPNFGTDVSRAQTVLLLQKLHQAGIFEDVNGQKGNGREFADNGRLFRLTKVTPSRLLRTPLALKNHLKVANQCRSPLSSTQFLPQPIKLDFDKLTSTPSNPDKESTSSECLSTSKPLTVTEEVEQQWKETLLESLQIILGVPGLDDIIDSRIVSGKNIRHNCLYINKSGVVMNIDPKDQFPHGVLSAMKCLAYWPDKMDANLPNYPNCVENVFGVVRDYFCGQSEPLMTYKLYDVIANVFDASNRRKSISASLLSHRQPRNATSGSKLGNTSDNVKNMLATRCFSMSDLPVASSSTVRNKQEEQWCGEIQQSEESVNVDESKEKNIKILQLICLLLPPANRRRLHLLFRIMNKISTNEKLVLDKTQSSRNLLLDTFYHVVLSCPDDRRMDDLLIIELVSFLMDNYLAIFMVPTYLKSAAEARIEKLQRTKIYYSCEDMSVHFCQQMSLDDYENQKMSASQQALSTLLDEIINDPSIAAKAKSNHLKQFQRTYPDIYVQRFPSTSNTDSHQQKTNMKQPCLAKPLLKLRGLRL